MNIVFIKRYLYYFIIIISIIIIIVLGIIFKNNTFNISTTNDILNARLLTTTNIIETVQEGIYQNEDVPEEQINPIEETKQEQITTESVITNNKANTTTNKKISKKEETQINSTNSINKEDNSQKITIKIHSQEEQNQEILTKKQEEKTQTIVTKAEETKQEIEKKYVVNITMINKLKKTIEDNETDNMKKYGYEIKTDSSIVNSTTGFTYSLFNINNSLVNRNGTIKIYAQDYIVNGNVVETRCYIL